MAASSFRDRLLTRRGARAIMSPVGIVGAVAVAGGTAVAGLPLVAAVPLGLAVWAVNGWRLLPRAPRRERIDPFTLQEPWRRFVQNALQARNRYAEAVTRVRPGPLRDRLEEIGARMETGVDECWQIARRGQALARARRGIDRADVERRLARAEGAHAAVTESLQVQKATADRLDQVIDGAEAQLRLLGARLDEAVARTLELSAHAASESGAVAGLGDDVDSLVTEMESLRLALDETGATP